MAFSFKRPEDSPGFLLWRLTNDWQRQQRAALAKLKLTHAQFVVLASLLWLSANSSEPVTQQQIADHASMDKMMISDLIKTLDRKKLLKRISHKDDARAYALTLTPKGKELTIKTIPIVESIDTDFFHPKTANLIELAKKLKPLIK
jgi:DNA-binding MarR family transcriptional regulator